MGGHIWGLAGASYRRGVVPCRRGSKHCCQVGELIRHQVEPASDRSFRPYGRRVLSEPRESEDFKKVMTWVDEEPRPAPQPAREAPPPSRTQVAAVPTPVQAAPAMQPPVQAPVQAPLAPFAAAPAGLPSSGSTVPPQAEAQGFEVPPGMRLEPVTRMQSVEPVTQEVRQAEPVSREVGGEEPSLSPEARWDEKDIMPYHALVLNLC